MKKLFKRGFAYIIDTMLVAMLTVLISGTPLNLNSKKLEKVTEDYQETYEYYQKLLQESEKLLDNKKVSEEKLDKYYNKYPNYEKSIKIIFKDKKVTKKEKENFITNIDKEFSKKYNKYFYNTRKLSIYQNIIFIVILILYFVIFAYIMNGETLGKRLMHLHIENNENSKLTVKNLINRSFIMYGFIPTLIDIILVVTLKESTYMKFVNNLFILSYMLELSVIFTTIASKDGRGIQDIIGKTKVTDNRKM